MSRLKFSGCWSYSKNGGKKGTQRSQSSKNFVPYKEHRSEMFSKGAGTYMEKCSYVVIVVCTAIYEVD